MRLLFLAVLLLASGDLRAKPITGSPLLPLPWKAPAGARELLNGNDLVGWAPVYASPCENTQQCWNISNGMLHLSGKPTGYLRTVESYAKFHLHAEWRWTGATKSGVNNSGIFIFVQEPDKVWPTSIQVQVKEGSSGDLIALGEMKFPQDCAGPIITKFEPSNEKSTGEWNSADIFCRPSSQSNGGKKDNSTSIDVFINGLHQNHLEMTSLEPGSIALQSEGSPVDFRNLWIQQP